MKKRHRQKKVEASASVTPSPFARQAGPYFTYGLIILSVAALVLRLYAAADNFWLDEIFNYSLAKDKVHSLIDVFTGIKVEHHFWSHSACI